MSCFLPPEILDLIIDQLHDEPATLKSCCVVSKPWIPRTRRHLFARVEFDALEHLIESWMKIFPDPSNSPAHHTRSLSIRSFPAVTTADADVAIWVRTFRNVVDVHFGDLIWTGQHDPLTPFYGFSHTVRSLRLTSTTFGVFNLICSFPLLEDLALVSLRPEIDTDGGRAPLTSPKLTGSLELSVVRGIRSAVRRLLDFPDGLRFSKVEVCCHRVGFEPVADLVSKCSGSLESLNIYSLAMGTPVPSTSPIDQYLTAAHRHRDVQHVPP